MGIRIATAIVLLILVCFWLFVADYPIFTMGALFIYMVAAYEMAPLLGFKSRVPFLFLAMIGSVTTFLIAPPGLYIEGEIPNILYKFIGIASIVWFISIPLLKSYPKNTAWHNNKITNSIIGLLMLLPFLQCLLILRAENYMVDKNTGAYLVIAVMALVWFADSGAYFAGRAFGKHKMLENVSPKKTMEGLYGGLALAVIGLLIFAKYDLYASYQDNITALIIAGSISIIFSVIGDLVESMFKRIVGIKDSGKIFPGHGGMLDRIDSQLAAMPIFVTSYLLISEVLA